MSCVSISGLFSLPNYEQPVVEPQLTHLSQLPFETKVNWPHSGQGSPSKPNLLASSFVLHWLDNPQEQLREWFNSLSSDGWIALAIPIKGSFPEWYEAAEQAKTTCTALDLPSHDSLIRVVPNKNILYNKIEIITQTDEKAISLLKPMIKVGAQSNHKGQLSISDWRHLLSYWPILNKDKEVSLSWSIQFLLIKR